MKGATKIALVAAIGNLLQGWDNGALAGSLLYIKPEFHLEDKPTVEGIVVAATLIGAVCSTIFAGPAADWLGRRLIMLFSALLYSVSACLMLWSPTVTMLIASRFLIGTGIGLVVTIVPIFIAETAPTEIRGQLATFPQFLGSTGLLVAYVMVFGLSLTASPSWRFMLGVIGIPAAIYLALVIFYVPESPRWLVSKGRMLEAKRVLQRLRDKEDVSAELALLVEGLDVGGAMYEDLVLRPAVEDVNDGDFAAKNDAQMKLFSPDEGVAWIATPMQDTHALSRGTSMLNVAGKSMSMLDPMVSLIGSLQHATDATADEDAAVAEDGYDWEDGDTGVVGSLDEDLEAGLRSPLIQSSARLPDIEEGLPRRSSMTNQVPHGSLSESVGIGSGWHLTWQWTGPEGTEGVPEQSSFKRVYLLQETPDNMQLPARSTLSLPGIDEESIPAAALIGQPSQYVLKDIDEVPVGPVMVHPSMTAIKGPAWADLADTGVKRALVVGMALQVLQQFSGINAVLYFIPQILQQSGADALLSEAGINPSSASILGSGVVSLLMMPCIIMAMRLMDQTGRRQLLLGTLPVLLMALIAMTVSNTVLSAGLLQALVSFASVSLYACSFVMGFGPIPNILCSEIFPTKVRGLCIGLCQATFWFSNIIVTYLFPILLVHFGLAGVFSMFAVVCIVAWIFIFNKVPETKGMPLEVISEFFALNYVEKRKGM